mgnify:CR=1 FL=1
MNNKSRFTLAVRRKISLGITGSKNPMFGKHHKKSTLLKISLKKRGKNNPMFGKHHSKATLKKMSLAIKKAFAKKRAGKK